MSQRPAQRLPITIKILTCNICIIIIINTNYHYKYMNEWLLGMHVVRDSSLLQFFPSLFSTLRFLMLILARFVPSTIQIPRYAFSLSNLILSANRVKNSRYCTLAPFFFRLAVDAVILILGLHLECDLYLYNLYLYKQRLNTEIRKLK